MATKTKSSKKTSTHTKKVEIVRSLEPAEVAAVVAPKQAAQPRDRFASLRKWNLILAAVHAVQGAAILLFSVTRAFPVTASYSAQDPLQTAATGKSVLALASHHLFDINPVYLVAAFFFLAAIAHLVLATVYRKRYETGLGLGINRVRWYEYALSASAMVVAIGLLVGVQESSVLLGLFGLTAVMNLCGLVMETHNRPSKASQPVNWLSYVVGGVAGIIPWIIIAIYLVGGATYGSSAPAYVYWVCGSIFLLFASFALNMALLYRAKGKWADYLYGERIYMVLSLVTKTLLAWQIFAGALRP